MSVGSPESPLDLPGEDARLKQLRGLFVLDSAPEPLFDSLARLACEACGTPIALMTLVDQHRQWFKASVGLPGIDETPREVAFCAHAIGEPGVMEVRDALKDARFVANPLVTGEPGIRFYAGAPLRMPGGDPVGTLCVIDRRPRRLSATQRARLEELAALVVQALAMRRDLIAKAADVRTDADTALRASERMLQRMGQVAGVGGWALDLATSRVEWTEQTRRIHEVDDAYQPTLETAIAFYAPEARDAITAAVEAGMRTGAAWDLELPFITAKGRSIWVRAVGEVERRDGVAVRLLGAFQEITLRKQAELALQRANDRFSIAARAAGIGVFEFEVGAGLLHWDDAMYALYGMEPAPADRLDALWRAMLHPDDRDRCLAALDAALRGEADYDVEFRIRRPDGAERHVKAAAHVQRCPQGTPLRLTGVHIDISGRKRAEIDSQATARLLGGVLDAAAEVAIIATRPDMTFSVFNRGAERMLGWTAAEVVGQREVPRIHLDAEIEQRRAELAARLGRKVRRRELFTDPSSIGRPTRWTYVARDGRQIPVSQVVTAMHDGDGRLLGYLGIAHDVSSQEQLQASLRDAKAAAEQASVTKSRFLANMSHELRSPMNAVIGLSYLLGRTALDAEQAELLHKLQVTSDVLLGLIDDVLDVSKIEARELNLESIAFDPQRLLDEMRQVFQVQAEARGLSFDVHVLDELPAAATGDPTRMRQVLTNLLSNAIKFTPRGSVSLRASLSERSGARVVLRCEIHDTGVGIAPEVAAKLFTPFFQAEASTARRYGGTGLGLAIVRDLVQLMGGRVGVRTRPDVGSLFWVELPLALTTAAAPPPPDDAAASGLALRGVRVLLVEDSDINREIAMRILMAQGAQVDLAADGAEALWLLQDQPGRHDVVLMDMQMPVLDGVETTRRLRTSAEFAELPVIALTANAMASERQRALDAGMSGFVAKPFDPRQIARIIRSQLKHRKRRAASGDEAVQPMPDTQPMPLSEPSPWPEIPGIDAKAVRERLGGDATLFARMLRNFVNDFSTTDTRAADLEAHMHRLCGSAGLLGATNIHHLAARAEAACRAGDEVLASALAHQVIDEVRALGMRADALLLPALSALPLAEAGATVPTEALLQLVRQLHERDLRAVESLAAVGPWLLSILGEARFAELQAAAARLAFEPVAQAVESCLRAARPARGKETAA